MRFSKKILKGLFKFVGPLLFIYFVIKVIDPQQTLVLLRKVRIEILIASLLLIPLVNAVISLRWWIISARLNMETSFNELFQIYYISWFLSILPLVGVSPLSKLIYLKENGKPVSSSLVSITVDKIFDVIGLIFFGIFGLVYFPQIFIKDFRLWFITAGMFFLALILWLFGGKLWQAFLKLIKRYTGKRVQRIGKNLEIDMSAFWSGFNINFFIMMLTISIAIGLLRAAVLYILAVSLSIKVSFIFIVACRALIGIVNVVPISINGLGTRDAILLLMFSLSGISREAAIALGFLSFFWAIISQISGGFFWLKHPIPFSSILKMKDKLST